MSTTNTPVVNIPPIPVYFIDIETVPQEDPKKLSAPPIEFYHRFAHKSDGDAQELMRMYNDTAGIYAEHGKVVAISIGKIVRQESSVKFYIKSLAGVQEKKILSDFSEIIKQAEVICGHYAKEFDFPYLIRRMYIQDVPIPKVMHTIGKKTWEIPWEDTMEMWGAGQWKYRCSMGLIAKLLGFPDPKTDIDGSQICELYYSMFTGDVLPEKEMEILDKISKYCNGDVITNANIYLRLKGIPLVITPEMVVYA